ELISWSRVSGSTRGVPISFACHVPTPRVAPRSWGAGRTADEGNPPSKPGDVKGTFPPTYRVKVPFMRDRSARVKGAPSCGARTTRGPAARGAAGRRVIGECVEETEELCRDRVWDLLVREVARVVEESPVVGALNVLPRSLCTRRQHPGVESPVQMQYRRGDRAPHPVCEADAVWAREGSHCPTEILCPTGGHARNLDGLPVTSNRL